MQPIAHYVHVHLAGAAAGIDLFGRSGRAQADRDIGTVVLGIRDQLIEERRKLVEMSDRLRVGESSFLTWSARLAERIGRLKPNGSLLHRTALTDLVELEAMRDAVAGKIAGWQALLAVVDDHVGLDRTELEFLLEQGEEQHRQLVQAHRAVASRVLVRGVVPISGRADPQEAPDWETRAHRQDRSAENQVRSDRQEQQGHSD